MMGKQPTGGRAKRPSESLTRSLRPAHRSPILYNYTKACANNIAAKYIFRRRAINVLISNIKILSELNMA